MNLYSVLKKPALTEKSNELRENLKKYTFLVDLNTNKVEIKQAVKKMFKRKFHLFLWTGSFGF